MIKGQNDKRRKGQKYKRSKGQMDKSTKVQKVKSTKGQNIKKKVFVVLCCILGTCTFLFVEVE